MFERIKLGLYEFFVYKIPDLFFRIKESVKDNPWLSIGIGITTIALSLAIYQGVQYNKYEQLRKNQEIAQKKLDKNKSVMNIPQAGAEAFLEQQLNTKNKEQTIKMFNDSVKYQGKYDEIIAKTKNFTKNSQFQDYLNPIVEELLSGPLVSQRSTGIDFEDDFIQLNSDETVNGVLLILIDSKNKSEVDKVKEIKSKKHDYQIKVYDKNSTNGEANFNTLRGSYLFGGNGERKGFNSKNDWAGVAYGFNDNKFVYHTKSLDDIPEKLPLKSLSKEDEDSLR